MKCRLTIILTIYFILSFSESFAQISPKDYGWNRARNGVERYHVLLNTHKNALRLGKYVDYSGMGVMNIEVPMNAERIPLGDQTDFKGCTINVLNNAQDNYIFDYYNALYDISIDKSIVDKGDFCSIPQLAKGKKLLIIEDQNVWAKRIGYDYQDARKDLILIEDGIAQNEVVYTYNTPYSNPKFTFCNVTSSEKNFGNLIFNRDIHSIKKSFLVHISCQNNFHINDIKVFTPESELTGDYVMNLENLSNLKVENVDVDGTYSSLDSYGYAISLDNVVNSRFVNLIGNTNWGFFGNYNVNGCILSDCKINRFDIHCYGKDVTCKGCEFKDFYNQISSFYGRLCYENCVFSNFVPVLIEPSFNAFTPFSLIMENCVWNVTRDHNYIVDCSTITTLENMREELIGKSWPDITIRNLIVNSDDVDDIYIFGQQDFTKGYTKKIQNLKMINVEGVKLSNQTTRFSVQQGNATFANKLNISTSKEFMLRRN